MTEHDASGTPQPGPYPVTPVDDAAVDLLIVTELKDSVLSYFGRVGAPGTVGAGT